MFKPQEKLDPGSRAPRLFFSENDGKWQENDRINCNMQAKIMECRALKFFLRPDV